jgi:nicotinamide mononucleotide transporter
MSPHELAAFLTGVVYVVLAVRQNVWCWPAGIVSVGLSVLVFYEAKLYADMGLNVLYVILSFYGWYHWLHGGPDHGALAVSRTPRRSALLLAVAGLAFTLMLGLLLKKTTDASLPLWDAATTSGSLVAQWMQTKKWLENWHVWIAVDLVYVGMYVYKSLYLMAGLYSVYLVLAVVGVREWTKAFRPAAQC